jgi:hypothetical protein
MIINGKSIRSIYQYNENAEYEKGDFVIDGDCIFICTAKSPTNTTNNTVKGKKPIKEDGKFDSENYKAYPGDLISDADEYYKIIKENGNGVEDKYVSSYALCEILRRTYFGVNENGIITDHILYSPEDNMMDYSVGSKSINEYLDTTTEVLTKIILEPDLNNGMVLVSKDLPEIKNLFIVPESSDQQSADQSYYDGGNNVVLLRQYTYIQNKLKWRVQELIDPKYGESFFRYLKSKKNEGEKEAIEKELFSYSLEGGYISTWKSNFGGGSKGNSTSKRVATKLNAIQEAYSNQLNDYEKKISNLQDSFKFKEIEKETPEPIFIVENDYVKTGELFTVVCTCITTHNGVKLSYSITIPKINSGTQTYYLGSYKDEDYYLKQTTLGDKNQLFMITTPGENNPTSGSIIDSVYYRNKYEAN